jgi:protein-S-isoprenylcysteine O-methyltransferase Ste14
MREGFAMTILLLAVGLALIWLIGSAVWSIAFPARRTWPPLRREGVVYRINSVLGPSITVGLFAVPVLSPNSLEIEAWLRFPLGGALFALGAYFSLGGVLLLGMRRTHGYEGELLESGPYRFSRNPQYVGATLGMTGLGLLCNSAPGLATALLAAVWWLLLPFAEEPWLRDKLGARYEAYAARVPRYLPLFRIPSRDR